MNPPTRQAVKPAHPPNEPFMLEVTPKEFVIPRGIDVLEFEVTNKSADRLDVVISLDSSYFGLRDQDKGHGWRSHVFFTLNASQSKLLYIEGQRCSWLPTEFDTEEDDEFTEGLLRFTHQKNQGPGQPVLEPGMDTRNQCYNFEPTWRLCMPEGSYAAWSCKVRPEIETEDFKAAVQRSINNKKKSAEAFEKNVKQMEEWERKRKKKCCAIL